MIWLLIVLWFAGAAAVGYPLARLALTGESRRSVVGSYALVAGHCLQGVVLLALWGVMYLGTAYYVTVGASLLAGALAHRFLPRVMPGPGPSLHVSRAQIVVLATLTIAVAVLGYRMFTLSYSTESAEALFFHAAAVGEMSRSAYPPTSPLEPDDSLRYRFGLHSLAAALAADSATTPPDAIAYALGMLLPLVVIAFYGASMRLFGTPLPGILASLFTLFGGAITPYFAAFELLGLNRAAHLSQATSGLMWHGNTIDMIVISVTATIGFVAFSIALWLYWEAARARGPSARPAIPAIVGFTYLGYVNEIYYSSLVAGIAAVTGLSAIHALRRKDAGWRGPVLLAAAILLPSFLLIQVRGGLAGGISLFSDGPSSMQLVLNREHLGAVIMPPTGTAEKWMPILSPTFQIDTNLFIIVVPLLATITWRTKSLYGAFAIAASLAAFVPWVLVYPQRFPPDIYRFGQAALVIYVSMIPMILAPVRIANRLSRRRLLSVVEPMAVGLLLAPHLARTLILMVAPVQTPLFVPGDPDYVAAQFLSQSSTTNRVLVPLATTDGFWEDMYDRRPNTTGSAMRTMLAFSGHSIPVGHQVYFNPASYLPYYREASWTFQPAVLARLKIDWVYVLPAHLDDDQRANLQSAVGRGELALSRTFGSPGTSEERWLYRVLAAEAATPAPS